ncbi:MAG: hypothetical protein H0U54_18460 [Acidobacteria bacterium]|nr:hypothetical protein [Acidobacteriota bacterium]
MLSLCLLPLITMDARAQGGAKYFPPGKVNPNPNCPQRERKYNLCFDQRGGGVVDNGNVSEFFYAIILRTAAKCSVTEVERLEVQKMFPTNKVFATRFECDDDLENNVTYANINREVGFIAVFAGRTLAAAKGFLRTVQATRQFPGANIRKTQVIATPP